MMCVCVCVCNLLETRVTPLWHECPSRTTRSFLFRVLAPNVSACFHPRPPFQRKRQFLDLFMYILNGSYEKSKLLFSNPNIHLLCSSGTIKVASSIFNLQRKSALFSLKSNFSESSKVDMNMLI